MAFIQSCLNKLKILRRLEETYEVTTMVKSAKLYMLKDKLSNFKMKDDESILEMFYRLQVIINDLKGLGEKVKDEDFIHKFLMCLPKRLKTLRTIIFRGGLTGVSPNEVLGDVLIKLLCSFDYRLCFELIMVTLDHVSMELLCYIDLLLPKYEHALYT